MNRRQWLLTAKYVLILGGSVWSSISGIKFSSDGGSFTAPHLNLAFLRKQEVHVFNAKTRRRGDAIGLEDVT
jgi:hypothetical protein